MNTKSMWRVPLAVSALVATMVGGTAPSQATFPARNGILAFSALTGKYSQVYLMRPDGTGLRQITHTTDGDATRVDWSPDGHTIVFAIERENGCSIATIRRNGSHLTDLSHRGNLCETQPSYTRNGRHIIFERYNGDTDVDALYSMDLHGHHLRRIRVVTATDPNVSPDGRTVSFIEYADGDYRQALSTVRIDGSHLRRVVPFVADVAVKQDWAPDGRHLVFSDNADVPDRAANVATVRPDGTQLRHLTHNTKPGHGAYVGGYSPNGRWIVYRQERDGLYSLWRMHPDGSGKHMILPYSTFWPRSIDWGPRTSCWHR